MSSTLHKVFFPDLLLSAKIYALPAFLQTIRFFSASNKSGVLNPASFEKPDIPTKALSK